MSHLDSFISMLKSAKVEHDPHDYLKDGESFTDVTVYFSKNIDGPCSEWVFSSKGDFLKVRYKKKAFA